MAADTSHIAAALRPLIERVRTDGWARRRQVYHRIPAMGR